MATPTGAERKLLAAGAKKGSVWGTAVAVGALNGLNVKNITGFVRNQDLLAAQEVDSPMPRWGQLDVIKPPEPVIITDMLYDSGQLGSLIVGLWGTAGAPAQQGGTAAYLHTIQFKDSNAGIFFTMVVEHPGKIYELASAKTMEWSLKSSGGGIIQSELKLRGDVIIDTSATNAAAQVDALTYQDRSNRMLFRHQVVKMNDQSGADVSGATALDCNSVEITIKRTGFDSLYPAGQYGIVEPIEPGYPDIRVKLGFPRFNSVNAAFFATAIAETLQKMTITFTGPLIAGAYYYQKKFYFPQLRMLNPDTQWEEIVKNGLELVAEEASANPTGMSYTRPYMEWINKRSTDYLA